MLDAARASDQQIADELGRKEAVLDHAGRAVEAGGELGRVVERAGVVGDEVAVRRGLDAAARRVSDALEGRLGAEGEHFERYWRHEPLDALLGRHDDDEAPGGRGHHLLARVGGAATLDQPAVGRHLIGAVDRDVQPFAALERLDEEAELACAGGGARRGRYAAQLQTALCQRWQEVADRRARSQPDAHAVLDEGGRGRGDSGLRFLVRQLPSQLETERYSARVALTRELLETRWGALRDQMGEAGLDGLLLGGRGVLASFGYVVFATGYTPHLRYSYVYLDAEGEPILWVPSQIDAALVRERGLIDDVRATGDGDWTGASVPMPEAVGVAIAASAPQRLGVAGLGTIIPPAHEATLRQTLAGSEIVTADEQVLAAKECKSEAELDGVREAIALARSAYDQAAELIRPGARAQAIVAQLELHLRSGGAIELLVFVERGLQLVRRVSDTTFEAGDLVSVVVEVANAEGYWVEIGGLFSIGEPSEEADAVAGASYAALERVVECCRADTPVSEAAVAFDVVAEAAGLESGVGLGHGVGVDHDVPTLSHASSERFKAGQVISIHPNLLDTRAGIGAIVADGAIVKAGGEAAERLSGLPSALTVPDPGPSA